MATEPDEYKRCPDCAELVRAQARVCRFCGYRFDRPEAGTGPQPPASRSFRWRAAEPTSVSDLLSDWGAELDSGEHELFFVLARARWSVGSEKREAEGFLLVTDRRMRLFKPPPRSIIRVTRSPPPPAEVALSLPIAQVEEAKVRRRWGRPELQIDDALVLSRVAIDTLEAIRDLLLEASGPRPLDAG
jgi:Uncharacterised protein family UPF0547